MDEHAALLQEHGYRLTEPRRVIVAALRDAGRYCTATQLYERLRGRAVGLASVYRTLELLADLGLAARVHGGRAVRYDPRIDPHHHLVCDACGAVVDLDAEVDLQPALELVRASGAVPARAEVLVRGRCAACA